jgi:hypothetical protein
MATKSKATKSLNSFPDPVGPTWVDATQINTTSGTQTRPGGTDPEFVTTFAEQMQAGDWGWMEHPPCNLFLDKRGSDNPSDWVYYPGDGHTRSEAAQISGDAVYAYYREGDARDAKRWSLTRANKRQGQGLTKSDLKHHARLLLQDPEWSKWSSQAIADEVGLSRPTVEEIRQELIAEGTIDDTDERIGLDGKTRKVEKNAAPQGIKVGDWIEGTLIQGHGNAQGYLSSIGRKYLKVKRDGREFSVLARDAKVLCRLPQDLSDLAPFFGLSRNDLALKVIQIEGSGWDDAGLYNDAALYPDFADSQETCYDYNGWQVLYGLAPANGKQLIYLGVRRPDYACHLLYPSINTATTIGRIVGVELAEKTIDTIEATLSRIPINPVEAGKLQPAYATDENATPPSTDFDAGSKPEATARPDPQSHDRQIKEVDNEDLKKSKDRKEIPVNADETELRLRLLLKQVDEERLLEILRDEIGAPRIWENYVINVGVAEMARWLVDECNGSAEFMELVDAVVEAHGHVVPIVKRAIASHASDRDLAAICDWLVKDGGFWVDFVNVDRFADIFANQPKSTIDALVAEADSRRKSVLGGVAG